MALSGGYAKGLEEEKINKHYQSQLANNKKSSEAHSEPVKDLAHKTPTTGGNYTGPMDTNLMAWTKILESLDNISDSIDQINADPMNSTIPDEAPSMDNVDDKTAVIEELNKIFTPILVMQGFESEVSDQIKEAFEQAEVLTERNIIKFDDQTRMSQLIATCALLLHKQRNTPKFQAYQKAAIIKNKERLDMIKDSYEEAKAIAQDYLVKVHTSNESPVARNAAHDLLPETQH